MSPFVVKHLKKLVGYQAGEQPLKKVIKLNTNENPYPPPLDIKKTLTNIDFTTLKNYPPLANDLTNGKLLDVIAKNYQVSNQEICLGNGSDEIISSIFKIFIGSGKKLLLSEYTYSAYFTYATIYNSKVIKLKMEDFMIDLPKALNKKFDVFLLTNPNAPTGIAIENKKIIKAIKAHPKKLFIIDEAYSDFNDESLVPEIKKLKNLIVIKTLSKGFSLAAIRLGFAFACQEIIESLKKVLDPYNINLISQQIALSAFTKKNQDYFLKNIQKVITTKQKLVKALAELHFTTLPSKTNFVFTSPPGLNTSKKNTTKRLFIFLKKNNILVRYFPVKGLNEFLRITIGTDQEIKKVIQIIKKYFQSKNNLTK